MNLIPKDIGFRIRWSYRRIFFVTSVILACSIAIAWVFMDTASSYYKARFESDQKVIARMDAGKTKMATMYGRLKDVSRDGDKLKIAAGALHSFAASRILWSGVLGDLSRQNLSGSWFKRIKVMEIKRGERNTRQLNIEGSSLSKNVIARLVDFMEGYPLFNNIRLEKCQKGVIDKREVYNFSITCEVVR